MQIEINPQYCKGCCLCQSACKKDVLALGKAVNALGYHVMEAKALENCIACRMCAVMCPEAAIEIFK
jgi:2-oxoglutarate ferredoxin oxidoreductase subunit delta